VSICLTGEGSPNPKWFGLCNSDISAGKKFRFMETKWCKMAKFQTILNFRNFGLIIRKRWQKIKKSISQLPWGICQKSQFINVCAEFSTFAHRDYGSTDVPSNAFIIKSSISVYLFGRERQSQPKVVWAT
jgi:hypothetical protein